jgi:hypothetical protein
VYEYQIPYLYCEVKFKSGLVEKGVTVLKDLLSQHPSDQKLLNMKYAICDNLDKGHSRLAPKTLVIHTGEIHFTWNPALPTKISGSEYMAMNIAKEFRDLGYRVFIFGQFLDEKDDKEKDYSKMTIKQLKDVLSTKGININNNKMKKNEMIELIEKSSITINE